MSGSKKVSLLFIGTELTNGTIQESHGRYMAPRLEEAGFKVRSMIILPDGMEAVEDLKREAALSNLVIVTGGLGPTSDDLTREIVAEACGCELRFHQELWEEIVTRFENISGSANKNQAYLPEGFSAISNKRGSAPGLEGKIGGTPVYVLPGPPRELHGMFDSYLLPLLIREQGGKKDSVLEASCFLVCESGLEEACRKIPSKGLEWGTRAQERRISLYIRGGEEEERLSFFRSLQKHFGEERIRMGNVDLPSAVFDLLREKNKTVACAESCTGGLFGKILTDFPGSSEIFPGGVIIYSDRTKEKYLGINGDLIKRYGAVSGETAKAAASAVRRISSADIGISFTGVAGPDGGTEENPVGTVWIGISRNGEEERAYRVRFTGSRERVRLKAVLAGFLLLEISIKDGKSLDRQGLWQYS